MDISVNSLKELKNVAKEIIPLFDKYRVVAFHGEMGVGKTTLIKEIVAQMGIEDSVTSPTFAIVNQYLSASGEVVNHFDFYRIDKPEEAFDMGYEEYFYGGELCLIEWPEKIEGLLPEEVLRVVITLNPNDSRSISIRPSVT